VLACRLCLKLGISDPEQWLEDVDDELWSLWKSYYALEPWGNENQLLASIAASLRIIAMKDATEETAATVSDRLDKLTALGVDPLWIGRHEIKWDTESTDSIQAFQRRMEGG